MPKKAKPVLQQTSFIDKPVISHKQLSQEQKDFLVAGMEEGKGLQMATFFFTTRWPDEPNATTKCLSWYDEVWKKRKV